MTITLVFFGKDPLGEIDKKAKTNKIKIDTENLYYFEVEDGYVNISLLGQEKIPKLIDFSHALPHSYRIPVTSLKWSGVSNSI